jgi:hypothetical protein
MAIIATERKTNIAWTPNAATFRSEVRKTATVGVIVELIATVTGAKPAEVA